MLFLVTLFAFGSLMVIGCKQGPTADQQAQLEEARIEVQASEEELATKKKERLRLEKQLPQ